MSISLYSIYAESCIELARSIIIKSEATARAMCRYDAQMNAVLTMEGEPSFYDPNDPTTWRYYMHMAGQYHRLDRFDTIDYEGNPARAGVIRVHSLDDYEVIDFTIENLREHRATWREYQKGSTYYRNLIDKYPDKRLLIDGILNPIPMHVAINARDNQILYYDKRYVEENEYSLMSRIQLYVDRYYERWDNEDYEITEDLYIPTKIAILYIYLPYVIMGFRYECARKIEAHSFHVWSYLGSHQWLDEYRYHLDLYQRMWFYRNIRWSELNAGKLHTFKKHIDVVMTHRNLPISEFYTHPTTDVMESDPEVFYPDVVFRRKPLNLEDHLTKAETYRSIDTMVENEISSARDNRLPHNLKKDKEVARKRITRSGDRSIPSKVVESNVVDSGTRAAIKKQDVDLNEWIYMTTNGLYRARISVANPTTAEYMNMTQSEALIVFVFALMKSFGLNPVWIPTITASNVLRLKKPKFEDVRKLIDDRLTEYTFVYAADHYYFKPEKIVSTERFAEFCNEVYRVKNIHRNLYSFTTDYREHVQVKTVTQQYYETVVCKLTEKKMSFSEYFKYKGWVLEDDIKDIRNGTGRWNRGHYEKLVNDITQSALGYDLVKSMSLKELQGMMVRLLKKLSSYSIQFLTKITEDESSVVDWPYLRYHKLGHYEKGIVRTHNTCLDFYNLTNKLFHKYDESLMGKPLDAGNQSQRQYHEDSIDLILNMDKEGETTMLTSFRMPSVQFSYAGETIIEPRPTSHFENPWDMEQFRIHKTTEDRSRIHVDDEGNLIVRGVVYVKENYKGTK